MEDKNQKTQPQTKMKVIVNGQTFHMPVVPSSKITLSAEEEHEGRIAPDHGLCDYDHSDISAAEFLHSDNILFSALFSVN